MDYRITMMMDQYDGKKIAIVHDFLLSYGGAERVLETFARMYPDAPIYTLLADERMTKKRFPGREIRTSFLQRFPKFLRKRYRWLLLFFPVAVETFDFRDFDIVISSSGAWSKGIVTRTTTIHIAYLHSPMRYLWDANEVYLRNVRARGILKFFGRLALSYLRVWDAQAAQRPDVLVSNSEYTRRRVFKYYRRESVVVYPPVTLSPLDEAVSRSDFFLLVARLSESKSIGVALEAFEKLHLPLRIVGAGATLNRLRSSAGPLVSFSGFVSDRELSRLYRSARAVIVPSEEDFGLVAAEALAHKTPVIALGRGGSKEVVSNGQTGLLFFSETPEVLADAVRRFLDEEAEFFERTNLYSREKFSEARFFEEWKHIIEDVSRV